MRESEGGGVLVAGEEWILKGVGEKESDERCRRDSIEMQK